MTPQRLFVVSGLCAAVLFTFITPPFRVPDEVGHFWRAITIADGHLIPRVEQQGGAASVSQGMSTLVFIFWRDAAAARDMRITREQVRLARELPLEPSKRARVVFPAGYTPLPYAPQAFAALIMRPFDVRPIITFYLGRLFNAIAYVVIIAVAIRVSTTLRWVFTAAALLPMALYLAASWAPDAMTIALSLLLTSLLLRGARTTRDLSMIVLCGVLVALCKPAYFLIVLLAIAVPIARRSWRVIILTATAVALTVSMWTASRMPVASRPDAHIDPNAQIECLEHEPMHFVRAFGSELRFDYVSQTIGRLGFLDIALPDAIIYMEVALLLLCAWSAGATIDAAVRVMSLIILLLSVAGIALASYVGWTPSCATHIDGLQGRYLLPIHPIALAVVSAPLIRREQFTAVVSLLCAVIANAVALHAVAAKYYLG